MINNDVSNYVYTNELLDISEEGIIHPGTLPNHIYINKVHRDPTKDLKEIILREDTLERISHIKTGYLVLCRDTKQLWYAHDMSCFKKNFVYVLDLLVLYITSSEKVINFYNKYIVSESMKNNTKKVCYILDMPLNSKYEVFNDNIDCKITMPEKSKLYKYKNRFHRDMDMIRLDKYYLNKLINEELDIINKAEQ